MITRIIAIVVLTTGMFIAAGCARTQREQQTSAPANQERAMAARDRLLAGRPGAVAGIVTAVRPEDRLVAVGDIDVSSLRRGDIVMFADSNGGPLVSGKVVRTTDTSVHVKYNDPAAGRRAPEKGDLMIRYP